MNSSVVQKKESAATSGASERDRFVGFAFAGADVLIEAQQTGRILFAAGACQTVLKVNAAELHGAQLTDIFDKPYAPSIKSMIHGSAGGGRRGPQVLRTAQGDTAEISMTRLPRPDSNLFIAVSARAETSAVAKFNDQEEFLDAAMASSERNQEVSITLLNLAGRSLDGDDIDPALEGDLDAAIAAYLQANAVSPNATGKVGDGQYGLVHSPDQAVEDILAELETVVSAVDPTFEGVSLQSETLHARELFERPEVARQALKRAVEEICQAVFTNEPDGMRSQMKNSIAETTNKIGWLSTTLQKRQFGISAQPIVSLKTQSLHHVEILCRFQENASPFDMITFAEDTALIQDLDLAVLDEALMAAKAGLVPEGTGMAVNVSGLSIQDPEFLLKLLQAYQDAPHIQERLLIEITESAQITDLETARSFVEALRKNGIQVCLDDFGAGASSFPYLQALDIDCVKIDGIYVGRMMKSEKDRLLVKSLAELCNSLGIVTVAEYVEDSGQVNALKEIGIHYAQGFYFGAPEPLTTPQKG